MEKIDMDLLERLEATGKWWLIGKGKTRNGEPPFGCALIEPHDLDGDPIVKVEGDDLRQCIERALADFAVICAAKK